MAMRWLSLAVVTLILGGCLNYAMVPPVRTTVANNAFSIVPGRTWNKNTMNNDERWTLDGNSLQELIFFNATNGQQLSSTRLGGSTFGTGVIVQKKDNLPPFTSTMTLLDIPEFIEASLTQLEAVDLNVTNFQAGKFGAADGFRFDIQFAYKTGLVAKGFVVGTVSGGRLVGMIFTAAETYYYARDLSEAERIVASIEFGGTVAPAETSLARAPVPVPSIVPAVSAKPSPVVAAPVPQTPPPAAAPRPAFVPAPIAATALPPCSSLPLVQPPGTRNINDAVSRGKDGALLPVAAPVRVDSPCIPDASPQGTMIRDVLNPGSAPRDSLKPISAPAAPAPAAANAASLPPCSSLPLVQPPGTRSISDATSRIGNGPVAAPVRVQEPCIPDPPVQGTTARDVAGSKGNLRPVTAPR